MIGIDIVSFFTGQPRPLKPIFYILLMQSNTEYLHDISLIFNLGYNQKPTTLRLDDRIPDDFGLSKVTQIRFINDVARLYRLEISIADLPMSYTLRDIVKVIGQKQN